MIYFLFGEMGAGKNFVGEQLAKELGCDFFDGDIVIPPEMADRVSKFRPLSKKMINDFVDNHLIPAILERASGDLVVAQALYNRRHRRKVVKSLDNVKMIYVSPPRIYTHLRRLLKRRRGFRWVIYFLLSKLFFQKPRDCFVIDNSRQLDNQIKLLTSLSARGLQKEG